MFTHEMDNNYISGNTKGRLLFAYYDNNGQLVLKQLIEDDTDRSLNDILIALSGNDLVEQFAERGTITRSRTRSPSRMSPRNSVVNGNGVITSPISTPTNRSASPRNRNGNGVVMTPSNRSVSPRNGNMSPRSLTRSRTVTTNVNGNTLTRRVNGTVTTNNRNGSVPGNGQMNNGTFNTNGNVRSFSLSFDDNGVNLIDNDANTAL